MMVINLIISRCDAGLICLPDCGGSRALPTDLSFRIRGVCRAPCNCTDQEQAECGIDGCTYRNQCFRECVQVFVSLLTLVLHGFTSSSFYTETQ